jgi:hypothetical protein
LLPRDYTHPVDGLCSPAARSPVMWVPSGSWTMMTGVGTASRGVTSSSARALASFARLREDTVQGIAGSSARARVVRSAAAYTPAALRWVMSRNEAIKHVGAPASSSTALAETYRVRQTPSFPTAANSPPSPRRSGWPASPPTPAAVPSRNPGPTFPRPRPHLHTPRA